MERGDIGDFFISAQACVFEGLLASPPTTKKFDRLKSEFYIRQGKWDAALALWVPHELPIKSLVHHLRVLGIVTEVVTFLDAEAQEAVYRWLLRKGISVNVTYYPSVAEYVADLKYMPGIRAVYVPDSDMAFNIGIRAVTSSPTTSWGL